MKNALIVFLLSASCFGQAVFCGGRETVDCRGETVVIQNELSKYASLIPENWRFTIQPKQAFTYWTNRLHIQTVKAYTELPYHRTWINEEKVSPNNRQELERFIAHEIAHIFCNESNESKTDSDAFRILMGKRHREDVCQ